MKLEIDDIELLKGMEKGDVLAFEAIYDRYSKSLFLYAMNIFKKKEVCEDIVQNVFVQLWVKRGTKKINSLKPFLFKSVKYQIFKHLRDKKVSDAELSRLNIVDTSMSVSQKLEYQELEDLIARQVDKLPKRCQQIFILSRFQYKSNKEIATELGISVQAVKNQISKALGSIRNNLNSEEALLFFLFFGR